jgi:hypothetical protein
VLLHSPGCITLNHTAHLSCLLLHLLDLSFPIVLTNNLIYIIFGENISALAIEAIPKGVIFGLLLIIVVVRRACLINIIVVA